MREDMNLFTPAKKEASGPLPAPPPPQPMPQPFPPGPRRPVPPPLPPVVAALEAEMKQEGIPTWTPYASDGSIREDVAEKMRRIYRNEKAEHHTRSSGEWKDTNCIEFMVRIFHLSEEEVRGVLEGA